MNPAEFKAIRNGIGWTQQRLAEELNVSREYVGLMERGMAAIERRTELALRYVASSQARADA
ncbi:helix-turn-helix protein [Novosphingobium sp. PhB55]|uniref:helix-turn-helix domain-containing protein n=1 Tax=Novosphingobium sp. PhB55 TaxID=2485106 RepID=UPI001066A114|nr:helix-turn-helix transcriptional regulator [Novosphingobium sp. PhB55]TDW65393.1 helix-turn-helix protein [Novosphingobium sp. PhB55]